MDQPPANALETRVLESLRDDGPQSSVMLVRGLKTDRLPLYAALRQLEKRGLVRPVGVTTTAFREPSRDQGPISLWGLSATPVAGA